LAYENSETAQSTDTEFGTGEYIDNVTSRAEIQTDRLRSLPGTITYATIYTSMPSALKNHVEK